ncbi:peroxisomal 2,4-dienoyl-CoA reductase [(3E)-enoyl-CoA-producing] isoform X1 [Cervus canadensis]|uniref:peroxisomal 2,4-dienoyl-CoA reductase [(3E)-enoyl-CoA-producing] isoform X1 n=1 Tax=Cervus canadensis TaxID=1574408 RepID=UPI001CA34D57|nr:peroxisomal 2,4-dienoyl-CoA reductase [(3E)-enoyl-CoA-producing] isoform X1 [Cervus canadensis]
MAQPPADVSEDDCLPEYHHLFCPDLLQDKVAFITGGGSGIGFRIAEIFMRHGCHTVIASRSLPRVSMAARKLAAATGRRCLPLSLDVRAPLAVAAAVEQALQEFGKIDILINCAAGNFLCPASSLSSNAFKTVMDIDTLGTFNVSRVLYEKFFRDHGGVIVNITATLGARGQVLQVHAGSAKAAVDAMTRHLAVEWGPQNIRVNSLAPGPISGTEGLRRLGTGQRAARDWSTAHSRTPDLPPARLPSLSARPSSPSQAFEERLALPLGAVLRPRALPTALSLCAGKWAVTRQGPGHTPSGGLWSSTWPGPRSVPRPNPGSALPCCPAPT